MDSDESWRDVFQRRVAEVDVPESHVAAAIAVAGARVRRRRRLRAAAPVGAVLAAAMAVGVITGTSRLLARPADPPPATTVTSPSPGPAVEENIVANLRRILSATGRVSDVTATSAENGELVTWLRYDDGHGPAAVTVIIARAAAGSAADWTCTDSACAVQTRADRSVVMTGKTATTAGTYQQWSAKLGRPDGVVITLIACNSDRPKGPVTRAAPPLSTDRLSSIVTDLGR